MKCSVCKKECEKPITRVDMSFDYGNTRYGVADWTEKKQYCGYWCMMKVLTDMVIKIVKKHKE